MVDDMIKESMTIDKYKDKMKQHLKLYFPDFDANVFDEALDYSVNKRYKNEEIVIHNNYKNKDIHGLTILKLCDYIEKRKPIVTSYGTMFMRHGETPNPMGEVIQMFLDERGIYKNEMFKYPKGSENFERYNLLQQLAKIDANAIYGLLGAVTALVFNINVAPSITRMGQSSVSSACLMFEMILANNVKFGSLDHVLNYINNIVNEKEERNFKDSDILKGNVSPEKVFGHLVYNCGFKWFPTHDEMDIIWKVVHNLHQEDLNRVYYKCNLYEFMEDSCVKEMVIELLKMMDVPYLDPLHPPKEIQTELDAFTDIMMEFVYYNYMVPDRIDRMKHMVKSICLISDTDSTIISMDAWYRYILENVKGIDMNILHQKSDLFDIIKFDEFGDLVDDSYRNLYEIVEPKLDYDFYEDDIIMNEKLIDPFTILPQDNLRYSIINILAYFLDRAINQYMLEFTKGSGSYSEDRDCKIIMKNEFLFKRTLLTPVKKSYATIQELQEGHLVPKEEALDVKGIASMAKSSMSEDTRKALKRILSEDILNAFEVNQMQIIKDLAIEDKKIYNKLRSGDKGYYKPVVIKSKDAYENPMRIQGIKASIAWNYIKSDDYPSINLDERNAIDIVKININGKKLEALDKFPEIKENVQKLFNSEYGQYFKGNVVESLAIPKAVATPDWVMEVIDYDTIISDNLSGFPLESVGIGKYTKNDVYTNVVQL